MSWFSANDRLPLQAVLKQAETCPKPQPYISVDGALAQQCTLRFDAVSLSVFTQVNGGAVPTLRLAAEGYSERKLTQNY